MLSDRIYPAKLMILGEYTVITGSMALATPLSRFHGRWVEKANHKQWPFDVKSFLDHLKVHNEELGLDLRSIERDLLKDIWFESNIPTGFGLGSSGSFVAGLYDRYRTKKSGPLKEVLALIESYFHGKSSGLDPLVSYERSPYLIKDQNALRIQQVPLSFLERGLWLLNSGISRRTEPLVRKFKEMLHHNDFAHAVEMRLTPVVDRTIQSLIGEQTDGAAFREGWSTISELQFKWFKPMIIDSVSRVWETGMIGEDFKIKLCGAGGGGFYLALVERNGEEAFIKSTKDLEVIKL
jgi:mevalonate kinase